eukprot:TRINITY_DN9443_c0_g1_i1.p1 TRINITY_DN9443_c0_g1~~TRINITY_DN9443_c0_g1_i1.p1  ORF type:complete len:157 (+),score=40.01 TRINITY_DN9443_c0_g1_i1:34-471(+)
MGAPGLTLGAVDYISGGMIVNVCDFWLSFALGFLVDSYLSPPYHPAAPNRRILAEVMGQLLLLACVPLLLQAIVRHVVLPALWDLSAPEADLERLIGMQWMATGLMIGVTQQHLTDKLHLLMRRCRDTYPPPLWPSFSEKAGHAA